jgi:hypothetical protein
MVRPNAFSRDEGSRSGILREARGIDGFEFGDFVGDGEVEVEELGEEVFFGEKL